MHPNVQRLVSLLPPPEHPRYNRGDWSLVEAELGTPLPDDFKDFTETYGAVGICNSLWFHTPFYFVGESAYVPLLGPKESLRDLLLSRLDEIDAVTGGGDHVPFPRYPSPGGLLPIGATDAGDVLCWITEGPPNQWGTFFWNFPGEQTFTFRNEGVIQFLLGLVTRNSPLFPSAMDPEAFQPEYLSVQVAGTRPDET